MKKRMRYRIFCSHIYLNCKRNKGEYFGIFLQLSQVSNVFGPILSSYLFKNYGTEGYFIVMCLITIISAFLALRVKEPQSLEPASIDQDRKGSEYDERTGKNFEHYKSFSNCKLDKALNAELLKIGSTRREHEEESINVRKLKEFVREQYQIKYYFSVFFLNGFFLGYYWSQIGFIGGEKLKDISASEQNEYLGFVYLLMGLTQIFLGRKFGASFDHLDEKIVFYKRIILITFLSMLIVLICYFLPFFGPFYLISVLFGMSEILIKSFIGGVLSLKFSKHSYESFAVYRLISNIASGAAMILSSLFTPEVPLVLMIAVFLNILACYRATKHINKHLSCILTSQQY